MLLVRGIEGNTINGQDNVEWKGKSIIDFRMGSGNVVTFSEGCNIINLTISIKGSRCRLEFGKNVRWKGRILIAGTNRIVKIGDDTTAQGVYLLSCDGDIHIGSGCMFSREIEVRTTDAHKIYSLINGKRLNIPGDVIIGDRVWVAARAILSKGSVVPSGCVVGAASFVNKAFTTENAVIAGVPASVVRENIRWER